MPSANHGNAALAAGKQRDPTFVLRYTIKPFRRHRLIAVCDADVIEVSTPEIGTTYRLEDDYARLHETEESRTAGLDR